MKITRRQGILNAALVCFNQKGIVATSMADLQKASRASIGSIYHHFGNKDGIAYSLYREGLQNYHDELLEKIKGSESAEKKIKTFVTAYMEWIESYPERASYIFSARSYLIDSHKGEEIQLFHKIGRAHV